jgi:hypothetical protein
MLVCGFRSSGFKLTENSPSLATLPTDFFRSLLRSGLSERLTSWCGRELSRATQWDEVLGPAREDPKSPRKADQLSILLIKRYGYPEVLSRADLYSANVSLRPLKTRVLRTIGFEVNRVAQSTVTFGGDDSGVEVNVRPVRMPLYNLLNP